MNERIPVHNTTAMPIYVGATMIPAGETRHFDLADVPHHLRPQPAAAEVKAEEQTDAIAELQKKSIKDVKAAVNGLSDEDLQRLIDLEGTAAKPRASLLEDLAAVQLDRAEFKAQ